MAKTKTEDALTAVRTAVAAARTLTTAEAELRLQHAELLKERKGVASAYASTAECVANLEQLIDARSAEWARDHGLGFARDLSGHEKHRGDGTSAQIYVSPKLPSWGDLQNTLTFPDLVGLVPDLVKRRLTEVVRASGARFGLPAEERRAKLAEIDAQIAALEDHHLQLVDGAAEVSIVLPLLDSVAKRREAAERATRLAADRERGVFPVSGASVGAAHESFLVSGSSVGGRA